MTGDHPGWVLTLSGAELRSRLENRGWAPYAAAETVRCARAGCPSCNATLVRVLG
jgi:broad-specificity NMP kinase